MVGNFVCKLLEYSHLCATVENMVFLRALFTKLNPNFHLLYILEFHGKTVVTI